MSGFWFISIFTWAAITAGVIALAIYRKVLARGEFDLLHLTEGELPLIPHQEEFAHQLERVDFWGNALTFASVSYGLVLCAVFLYQAWTLNT